MNLENLFDDGITFFRDHTIWAVSIAIVIGALIYWKPKGTFRVACAGMVIGVVIYVLSFLVDLTSQGIDEVEKFTATPKVEVD